MSKTTTEQYYHTNNTTMQPPRSRRTRRKHPNTTTTTHHYQNEIPIVLLNSKECSSSYDRRERVNTLASGRKKIVELKNVNAVVLLEEEEIQDLADKLNNTKPDQVRHRIHFDNKKDRRNVVGMSDHHRRATNKSSLSKINTRRGSSISNANIKNKSLDMDLLRKKMEGLSSGILKRVEEEYGSMLLSGSNSCVATPASTSKRFDGFADLSSISTRQLYQGKMLPEENKCTGRCKAVVRRIVEQVRAEAEQWSQMQEMVGQVRGEMEELQASRDFWESRAYSSENEIQSLRHSVKVWKEKALRYDMKANELQLELSALREEYLKSNKEKSKVRNKEAMLIPEMHWAPLKKQLQMEKLGSSCRFNENGHVSENWCEVSNSPQDINLEQIKEPTQTKDLPPLSLGRQLAEENKTLFSHLQEDCYTGEGGGKRELVAKRRTKSYSISDILVAKKRSPLGVIENLSPLARQNGRAASSLRSPESSRRVKSLWK